MVDWLHLFRFRHKMTYLGSGNDKGCLVSSGTQTAVAWMKVLCVYVCVSLHSDPELHSPLLFLLCQFITNCVPLLLLGLTSVSGCDGKGL